MSKRIKLKKDGVIQRVTVSVIRTKKVGGGTCDWIPVDETATMKKTITDNGTYEASADNVYGYSSVVLKDLYSTNTFGTLRITKNGTYTAEELGLCGLTSVTVNVT